MLLLSSDTTFHLGMPYKKGWHSLKPTAKGEGQSCSRYQTWRLGDLEHQGEGKSGERD